MESAVIKLPDEPIVIVTVRLPIHEFLDDLALLNQQVADILATTQGPVYRISDTNLLSEGGFSDLMLALGEQRAHPLGSVMDPRVKPILVGTGPMLPIVVRKVAQHTGVTMPLFATLDEALAYARAQIAAQV
jgi:hypothetical protein